MPPQQEELEGQRVQALERVPPQQEGTEELEGQVHTLQQRVQALERDVAVARNHCAAQDRAAWAAHTLRCN